MYEPVMKTCHEKRDIFLDTVSSCCFFYVMNLKQLVENARQTLAETGLDHLPDGRTNQRLDERVVRFLRQAGVVSPPEGARARRGVGPTSSRTNSCLPCTTKRRGYPRRGGRVCPRQGRKVPSIPEERFVGKAPITQTAATSYKMSILANRRGLYPCKSLWAKRSACYP